MFSGHKSLVETDQWKCVLPPEFSNHVHKVHCQTLFLLRMSVMAVSAHQV